MHNDWEPIMMQYGVDLYMCGHEHNYESIYPVANNSRVQDDFVSPLAPVHVVSGAGGAPPLDTFGSYGPWTRLQDNSAWSYSKVEIQNASTLVWQQWYNSYYCSRDVDGNNCKADEFTIVQPDHSPFAPTLKPKEGLV